MPSEIKKLIAENRRARFDYLIEEVVEAGIILVGTEVKSLREGQANIAESYEITKFLFIQMGLCYGNLNTYLEKRTSINYLDSKSIFKNILEGLSYLHKMNIIHRDIKPSNIMFDKNGITKIGDFGMSIKYKDENSLQKKIVKTENEYGSYNYLSPETIENKEYSIYSDIYSLGIILFELLSTFDTYMEN